MKKVKYGQDCGKHAGIADGCVTKIVVIKNSIIVLVKRNESKVKN